MEEKATHEDILEACDFLKKKEMNSKKIKRVYLGRFDQFGYKCAFAKTNLLKKYKELSKDIVKLYQVTIDNPICRESGNCVVVTAFIDYTLKNINIMKIRLENIKNIELLTEGHKIIIDKMEYLIKVLNSNLQDPITLKEVEDTLKSKEI